jgi:hypothetical protein
MVVNIRSVNTDYDVYVGRVGGYFGNPIRRGEPCLVCAKTHYARGDTLDCFEMWARARSRRDVLYRDAVKNLYGKTLGCFCKPKRCHGDTLERLAAELNGVMGTAADDDRDLAASVLEDLEDA